MGERAGEGREGELESVCKNEKNNLKYTQGKEMAQRGKRLLCKREDLNPGPVMHGKLQQAALQSQHSCIRWQVEAESLEDPGPDSLEDITVNKTSCFTYDRRQGLTPEVVLFTHTHTHLYTHHISHHCIPHPTHTDLKLHEMLNWRVSGEGNRKLLPGEREPERAERDPGSLRSPLQLFLPHRNC